MANCEYYIILLLLRLFLAISYITYKFLGSDYQFLKKKTDKKGSWGFGGSNKSVWEYCHLNNAQS
jgi:hypothetical protein